MLIDFQPILAKEKTLSDLAKEFNRRSLGDALTSYVDFTRQVVENTPSDELAAAIPDDPLADDPHAASEEERHVGWSLVHLVTHVTASAEEGAAFSSLLARGIAIGSRLRSEQDWRQVKTRAAAVQRLEECRRICLGYLAAWPDQPDLAAVRLMPEHLSWLKPNAPVSFLHGLLHWHLHLEQIQLAAGRAAARPAVVSLHAGQGL